MRIVLDTNVLVSGFLSPYGPPGAILRSILAGSITLCFDERILTEYRDVLTRGRFAFSTMSLTKSPTTACCRCSGTNSRNRPRILAVWLPGTNSEAGSASRNRAQNALRTARASSANRCWSRVFPKTWAICERVRASWKK